MIAVEQQPGRKFMARTMGERVVAPLEPERIERAFVGNAAKRQNDVQVG